MPPLAAPGQAKGRRERSSDPSTESRQIGALRWVRNEEGALLGAVRELELPGGAGHCFVHGEASAVREVRKHLLLERGVEPERLSASGYWKRRRTDEEWRADKAEWLRQAELDTAGALP